MLSRQEQFNIVQSHHGTSEYMGLKKRLITE